MGMIIRLSEVQILVKPYTATLVGGAFDLFHIGHLRYLKKCSEKGKPLIVVVQSDKGVKARKGLNRPIISEKERAELVISISFVDYVLILKKPSYYRKYLEIIKPKRIIFSKENLKFRLDRKRIIESEFPKTKVSFIAKQSDNVSTSRIIERILSKPNYDDVKNPYVKRLHQVSEKSKSSCGKISALIIKNKKIIAEACSTGTRHAEEIVMINAKKKTFLKDSTLYVTTPPCILCAGLILKNGIKEVFYAHASGVDDGISLLKKNKVKITRI